MNAKLTRQQELTSTYPLPKATCRCGHSGDGLLSAHEDRFEVGHGACKICACGQFAWGGWTASFQEALDAL